MEKLFIEQLPIEGKRVLVRVDFNVPLDGQGNVTDAARIEAALPTIRYILDQKGIPILISHLGRPHGSINPEFSLRPCVKVLSGLLNRPVKLAPDIIGHEVEEMVKTLEVGEILMLENVRFHRAEEHPDEDPDFAKQLASYGDLFVNDAFGAAHRNHSSTCTITKYFPNKSAAGYLLAKEIHFLGEILSKPAKPFCALIGGAKISSKMGVLRTLVKRVDTLLIGGGMSYTFFKAQGIAIGKSICEENLVSLAQEIIEECVAQNVKLLLPLDIHAAEACSEDAPSQIVDMKDGIPSHLEGLDIGPKTIALFSEAIMQAKTLLWNGPVGVFEFEPYAKGTTALALVVGKSKATSIVGGGDSLAALKQAEALDKVTHVSTGGGATIEFIEHGTLPAIEALSENT